MHSLDLTLDDLRVFRYDTKYRQYLGDAFVDRFSTLENNIRQRKDEPFTIVVAGAFKRGKSTLINALLKENVVTMDVTPETVTTNRVSYGSHSNEAILSGNRRVKLTDEELKRESLENLLEKLHESITEIEIHRPNEFLKRITIIDTPGTDDAMKDYSEAVKKSLLQADAIIYVFNVKYPISQTEQFFIRSAILPQKLTNLFVVGNQTDDLYKVENVNRVKDTVLSRLSNLLPDAKIYMVSALDELCNALGENRICPELSDLLDSEFSRLRNDIYELVEEKSDGIVVARLYRMITSLIDDLSSQIDNIENGIKMSELEAQEIMKKLATTKEESVTNQKNMLNELNDKLEFMKDETKNWMHEFLQRMVDETRNLNNEDVETLRKYYEYYCIDLLQQALNICVEYHREQLYDILGRFSSKLSEKFTGKISMQDMYQFRFKLDNRIWTKGDTAGLAVSLLSRVPILATIGLMAADGITGYIRERELKKRNPELISQINKKMTELSVSIDKTIDTIYQTLKQNLKLIVNDYFSEEMSSKEEMVRQAVDMSTKEEANKKEITSLLMEAKNILSTVERRYA